MEQETVKTSLDQPKEKNRFVSVALVVLILALLGGITYAVLKKTSGNNLSGYEPVSRISKEEMELLMKEVNPMMLQKLAQDPEAKKELANNVQELFAIANQAKKEGLTNQENIKREMDNVRTEIIAINYDRTQNKDKEQAPPFSSITEEQVNQFWAATDGKTGFWDKIGLGENTAGKREQAFQKFLDAKVNLAKEGGQMPKDREISEEEMKQAKEYYAKTRIAAAEAEAKRGELGAEFWQKVELQTKLQQAQFLARTYAQKNLEERTKVTDEDVQKYLAEHPEINNTAEKKVKAEEILQRVKGGEDFAKLAKEFSEDPGSKDKGGLYEGITEGSFVPEFETVAFSLEPGQIAENLVESKFGYHIIKLEKKGETKGADGQAKRTFDARHILIQTGMKDPENPLSQPMPVNDFVKQKLAKEKEEQVLAEIKANNPVEVAQDFNIPEVSQEQMNKMMQQQMQQMNQPPMQPEDDSADEKKPEKVAPKKK